MVLFYQRQRAGQHVRPKDGRDDAARADGSCGCLRVDDDQRLRDPENVITHCGSINVVRPFSD